MFCNKCGQPIGADDDFCTSCGAPAKAEARRREQTPQYAGGPQPQQRPPGTGAAAFFSSPGGIVLIIAVALIVIAGIVVGTILATRSGGDSEYKKGITEAWDDFLENVEEIDGQVQTVSDLNPLVSNSAPITEFLDDLDGNRTTNSSILSRLNGLQPPADKKAAYEHLVQACKDYNGYLEKSTEFYTVFMANPGDPRLDTILTDMKNLAAAVETHVGGFLEEADIETAAADFDPAILDLEPKYAARLAAVRQTLAEQAAQQAARQAAQRQQNEAGLESAVLGYVEANWWPYERAWVSGVNWTNDAHTSATVTVGVVGGDASTTYNTVYATKSGGVWSVSE